MTNLQTLIDHNKELQMVNTQYLATIQVLQERNKELEEACHSLNVALATYQARGGE